MEIVMPEDLNAYIPYRAVYVKKLKKIQGRILSTSDTYGIYNSEGQLVITAESIIEIHQQIEDNRATLFTLH